MASFAEEDVEIGAVWEEGWGDSDGDGLEAFVEGVGLWGGLGFETGREDGCEGGLEEGGIEVVRYLITVSKGEQT